LADRVGVADAAMQLGLHESQNFGHQIAVTAGLDHAVGDVVVVIDADLENYRFSHRFRRWNPDTSIVECGVSPARPVQGL
jgi:hypothetical protein